jgi:hypothetical protein
VIATPNNKRRTYSKNSLVEKIKQNITMIYIIIPKIKIGFLPFISPSLVKVTQPMAIPIKKNAPKSPTLKSGSQKKFS